VSRPQSWQHRLHKEYNTRETGKDVVLETYLERGWAASELQPCPTGDADSGKHPKEATHWGDSITRMSIRDSPRHSRHDSGFSGGSEIYRWNKSRGAWDMSKNLYRRV